MKRKLPARTRWFRGTVNPARSGMYEVQTPDMRCDCCWTNMRFDAVYREWFTNTCSPPGYYTTHHFGPLRRWRGLVAPSKETMSQEREALTKIADMAHLAGNCCDNPPPAKNGARDGFRMIEEVAHAALAAAPVAETVPCKVCSGRGRVVIRTLAPGVPGSTELALCDSCRGSGKVYATPQAAPAPGIDHSDCLWSRNGHAVCPSRVAASAPVGGAAGDSQQQAQVLARLDGALALLYCVRNALEYDNTARKGGGWTTWIEKIDAFRGAAREALPPSEQADSEAAQPTVQAGAATDNLFELWWADYMPEATRDLAWRAYSAALPPEGAE